MSVGRQLAYWRLRRRATAATTFQQKVLRKIAFDRDPVLTTMCDRIAVRDLVAATAGADLLPLAYAVDDDPSAIDWAALPREYAVKTNHGSGAMVFVRDDADPQARLPTRTARVGWDRLHVRPEHADPRRLEPLLRRWLAQDYSWYPGKRTPEWAYEGIRPRLLVEELLRGDDGRMPVEYKVYVIHGRAHFTVLMFDRFAGPGGPPQSHCYYDRDWNRLHVQFVSHGTPQVLAGDVPAPPAAGPDLIDVAEALGALTDAVRVDLYLIGDRIVFGEMTPYQNAGEGHYLPASFDQQLAAGWQQAY